MVKPFDLVGGRPALDLVNTVSDWVSPEPREDLPSFAAALRFGRKAGVLSAGEEKALLERGERRPREAAAELARLRELRGLLHGLFAAVAAGAALPAAELDALSGRAAEAAAAARLAPAGSGRVEWRLDAEHAGLALLRHRAARDAADLLTSQLLARVKSCPSCGWLFLDVSKNRSRRWCSMDTCGGAAKARSYYRRKKDARSTM